MNGMEELTKTYSIGPDEADIVEMNSYRSTDKEIEVTLEKDEEPKSMSYLRKWVITLIIAGTSFCMTIISSCWSMLSEDIEEYFHISRETSVLGITLYIFGLGLGPTFLSPVSEYHGRKVTFIGGLFFAFAFQFLSSFSNNFGSILFGRFMTGFSGSAFMTVAAGTLSDIFEKIEIGSPMLIFSLTPFLAPLLGPTVSGAICTTISWRWVFHVMLIFTFTMLCLILFFVPETYHPVLLKRKAVRMRKETGDNRYFAPLEKQPLTLFQSTVLSSRRPVLLLFRDPMMLVLCFYSGVVLAIVYMFFVAFPYIFRTVYGFSLLFQGLSFLGLVVGMLFTVVAIPLIQKLYVRQVKNNGGKAEPEFRLPLVMLGSVNCTIGLWIIAWVSYSNLHWIGVEIGAVFYGLGTALVLTGIFNYTIDGYRLYAASGMAANSLVRSYMAGIFPLFTYQMYVAMGIHWATTFLAFLSMVLIPLPFIFYKYGKALRARSPYGWTDD